MRYGTSLFILNLNKLNNLTFKTTAGAKEEESLVFYYSFGQRLQLVLPFFLYFLQHFFFLFIVAQSPQDEGIAIQGDTKNAVFIIFIKSK